jgi:hypothetical protein
LNRSGYWGNKEGVMTFKLKRIDIEFLLDQVTIGVDYSQLINALDPGGLREVAGTNNNLVGYDILTGTPGPYTNYGASDTPFLRLSQTEQTSFRSARLIAASTIAPAIRLRIHRCASACGSSRIFWRKWEAQVLPFLTNPLIWTLIALTVSSIGLYWDLR